jgi:hypothetical protein
MENAWEAGGFFGGALAHENERIVQAGQIQCFMGALLSIECRGVRLYHQVRDQRSAVREPPWARVLQWTVT